MKTTFEGHPERRKFGMTNVVKDSRSCGNTSPVAGNGSSPSAPIARAGRR
jgi:hypothetical protein